MSRDDASLVDIELAARKALGVVSEFSWEEFRDNWRLSSAVEHQLTIIGEAIQRLSPEFREKFSDIPWRGMAGLRDIIVHHYDDVDLREVWLIARRDLPPLLEFLESILPQPPRSEREWK